MNQNLPTADQKIDSSSPLPGILNAGWSDAWSSDHVVQFYEVEEALLNSLFDYVLSGLEGGEACLIVATQEHRDRLDERLLAAGLDLESSRVKGKYVCFDAATLLSRFFDGDILQQEIFDDLVGGLISDAVKTHGRVRIYGEMVALLWANGNYDTALQLEEFWNHLQKTYSFLLLCGYPVTYFSGNEMAASFQRVCRSHSHLVPAECSMPVASSEIEPCVPAESQQDAHQFHGKILKWERVDKESNGNKYSNDDLLLAIARELRSQAALIHNAVERLRKNQPRPLDAVEDAGELIHRQVNQILKITSDVLDFVKFSNGKYPLHRERIDILHIITEAIKTIYPLIKKRKQKLRISQLTSVQIELDVVRIVQAISNLLERAATITDEGGNIEIGAEQKDQDVLIRIKDQGPSISAKSLPVAADQRTQEIPKPGQTLQGLGAGVPLAVLIIESHGGTVEAFSFGLGYGNEVHVKLPLC